MTQKTAYEDDARQVRDLKAGDRVDLEGDMFADPGRDIPELAYEYQVVQGIEVETPTCTAVEFEGFDVVGFPPDHYVRVKV